jgi:anaerobic ribonucleoside-triphosphate reductase
MTKLFNSTKDIINKFISKDEDKRSDYLKRENSNFVHSLSLLRKNLSNHSEEEYLMEEIFPRELVKAHQEGIVYIHDKQLSSYCQSISCKDIATFGVPTLAKNMIASTPTKRLRKLFRHFSNLIVFMSQQVSGAVMLAQMSTILASYLQYEEEKRNYIWSEDEIKEEMQSFIWELNLPLRSGSESAFSNCTLEFGKPSEEIKDEYVIIGGEIQDYLYKDIPQIYYDRINKALIDVMAQGSGKGIPFTFPLITIQIDDNFNYDNPQFLYLLDKMYRWGGIYLENFRIKPFENEYYKKLNPYIEAKDPSISRSLCCRLNIDGRVLNKIGSGGIFGSSVGNVGAIEVTDINMDRLLIECENDFDLLKEKLSYYLELIQQGHMAKRQFIENNKELYPTFFSFNQSLKNYFNVFGVIGMHEGLINIGYKDGLNNPDGKEYAHKIMQYMREVIDTFIVRDKVACGIEASPAENAGVKLARNDKKFAQSLGKEIFVQGYGEDIYLTSGCMIPFSEDDFLSQIENAAEFQGYYTSGSILHHFIESKIEPQQLAKYISKLFEKPINYITFSPTITSCMNCGQMLIAKDGINIEKCPKCGSDDIATFSRVIGYTKMIARKGLKVDKNGLYKGKYNFWSNARRYDWSQRKRVLDDDLNAIQ